MNAAGKEKLVVEVVAAHNLMPKDGEGSSSPFVEIEFENQRQRTQVKYKDLNPVWNEKLVFHINSAADLPYRTIEANVFNERRSSNSRNFLGKIRVSGSNVGREGEEVAAQLFSLDKRSLFSHVRGEISLKLYLSSREEVVMNNGKNNSGFLMKKSKKQGVNNNGGNHHLGVEHLVGNLQNQQILKQGEQNPAPSGQSVAQTAHILGLGLLLCTIRARTAQISSCTHNNGRSG